MLLNRGTNINMDHGHNWLLLVRKAVQCFIPTTEWIVARLKKRSGGGRAGAAAMAGSDLLCCAPSEDNLINSFKVQLQSCMFTNEIQGFFHRPPPGKFGCFSCGRQNKKCTRSHVVKRPILIENNVL